MVTYRAPIADMRFLLDHVVPLAPVTAQRAFSHVDPETVAGVLEEAGRFAAEVVAPTNLEADQQGATFDDGVVRMPATLGVVQERLVAAGWPALAHPVEHGGGGFPLLVANLVKEMLTSANMAFSLGPLLTTSATLLLLEHGSQEQIHRYVGRMVAGEWAGTMNLTEPQAGSDLGRVAAKAEPADDGTYRLTGQKIFITYGEHDLTEQIVHLVLARLPGAPDGTGGLSLFIVPKLLVGPDGELGERNDVVAASIEHKLGIHASPTCTMLYGSASDGAVAELVGEPHQGMRLMFTMMNDARLGVGLQGVAIAERAFQQSTRFAGERMQGYRGGDDVPIIEHPDVRRMLMTQKASIEAVRALCAANAVAIDLAAHADEPAERDRHRVRADLLTPLAKSWATDVGVEMTSLALQVHGGMGYVEETGVAQHLRDARIAPIYEGTNGIQSIDFVGRKVLRDAGAGLAALVDELRDVASAMPSTLAAMTAGLREGIDEVERVADWIVAEGDLTDDVLAGASPAVRAVAAVTAAALLCRGATAAARLVDGGPDAPDAASEGTHGDDWLRARIASARFFVTQLLPIEVARCRSVTLGADAMATVAADPSKW